MSTKWNSKIQFPADSSYIDRITEASFGPSKSSQNPMITLETEVLSPDIVEIGGENVEIAGVKSTMYFTTQVLLKDGTLDSEKTDNCIKRCKELMTRLFPDNPERAENFNPENPDLSGIKGLCVFAHMGSDTQEARKSPTAEQLMKGIKQGEVMKNPITGVALVYYRPVIREVFGLAPKEALAGGPF